MLSSSDSNANNYSGLKGSNLSGGPIQRRKNLNLQTNCAVGVCTFGENVVESHAHAAEEKLGVLLLNLGGPETLNDVFCITCLLILYVSFPIPILCTYVNIVGFTVFHCCADGDVVFDAGYNTAA